MNLLLYGVIALAILGTLGGIGYKVRQSGYDACKVEWAEASAAAQKEIEADRKRQDDLRQEQDKLASRRLADEKKRTQTLWTSLEAHIRVAGKYANCPIPDSLRDDWNRANAGPKGLSPGTVPTEGRSPTTPR